MPDGVAVSLQRVSDACEGFLDVFFVNADTGMCIMGLKRGLAWFVREACAQGEHSVDKIAIIGIQFGVYLRYKIRPIKVGVAEFRHDDGKVISEGVRMIAFKKRREPNRMFSRF